MPSLWTPEQTAFREEVRLFLRENLADETRQKVRKGLALSKDDHEKWHDALAAKGWYAGFWPEEYGGKGWDAAQTFIFNDEYAYYGVTRPLIPQLMRLDFTSRMSITPNSMAAIHPAC